jgi:cellulose synthase/poly-beta-1,6-N-acetylglucosamine synthase-like glycosyltransferase
MGFYFGVINAASIVGIYRGTIGRVSGVWSTPRESSVQPSGWPLVPTGRLFLMTCGLAVVVMGALTLQGGHAAVLLVLQVSAGALLYIYLVYPLILVLLGVVMRRARAIRPIEPSVCVFIAANDEAAVIEAKVRNTLDLDYPQPLLDIVVASDGSVDGTNEIVQRFGPRVRLLEYSPRQGKIATIIKGVQELTADIVVFSDANTFLDSDAIRSLVRNFADPSVGCVSGDVILIGDRAMIGRSEDLYYRYERWLQYAESEVGSMIGADGALYAIRRHLFVAPASDTILDDMAIPMGVVQQGYRSIIEPVATAHEQGVGTALEEFWRKSRVIAGAIQFLSRRDSSVPLNRPLVMLALVSHKGLRWLTPVFVIGVLASSIALSGSSVVFGTAALAQGLVLVLGLAGCAPTLRRLPLVGVAHYCLLVLAAAGMGFIRGLRGGQSVLWRRFHRASVTGPA